LSFIIPLFCGTHLCLSSAANNGVGGGGGTEEAAGRRGLAGAGGGWGQGVGFCSACAACRPILIFSFFPGPPVYKLNKISFYYIIYVNSFWSYAPNLCVQFYDFLETRFFNKYLYLRTSTIFICFLETYVHIFRHVREDTHKKSSYKNYASKTYVHKFIFEIILLW
jgi:hypothetical protein